MSWTRLDDRWTDLPVLADLDHDVRWHYLSMIQFCSRTGRYDGILRASDARRCSDVDDPAQALSALVAADLVTLLDHKRVQVRRIDEHIPPPGVRENAAKSKVRMQRHRKHKNGDHSECLPDKCDQITSDTSTGEVTGAVTRNTGTGQDRTGQDDGTFPNQSSGSHTAMTDDQFELEAQFTEEQWDGPRLAFAPPTRNTRPTPGERSARRGEERAAATAAITSAEEASA